MTTWSEIKQATLNKLFLTQEEALQENHLEKMSFIANECLSTIANAVKPNIKIAEFVVESGFETVEMPDDFISFRDVENWFLPVGSTVIEPNVDIVYLTDTKIILDRKGTYGITYNAHWEPINDNDNDDIPLNINKSVVACLPSYIASQLVRQDDPQTSAILRNDFEVLLSRLDDDTLNEARSFKSQGGWY